MAAASALKKTPLQNRPKTSKIDRMNGVKFVTVPVIRTDDDHEFASRRLTTILSSLTRTLKNDPDEIRVMAILVHHHVATKMPETKFPDPVTAIKFRMKQLGLAPSDLVRSIGHIETVHKVLNRKRDLTIQMIRRLHKNLDIPANALIQPVRHWGRKKAA